MTDENRVSLSEASKGVVQTEFINPANPNEVVEVQFHDPNDEERQELTELEERMNTGDEDAAEELQDKILHEYLVTDDSREEIEENYGIALRQSIQLAFWRAIGGENAVDEALEFFDKFDDEVMVGGNR